MLRSVLLCLLNPRPAPQIWIGPDGLPSTDARAAPAPSAVLSSLSLGITSRIANTPLGSMFFSSAAIGAEPDSSRPASAVGGTRADASASEEFGAALAARLSKRTGFVCFVSFNLSNASPQLQLCIEQRVAREFPRLSGSAAASADDAAAAAGTGSKRRPSAGHQALSMLGAGIASISASLLPADYVDGDDTSGIDSAGSASAPSLAPSSSAAPAASGLTRRGSRVADADPAASEGKSESKSSAVTSAAGGKASAAAARRTSVGQHALGVISAGMNSFSEMLMPDDFGSEPASESGARRGSSRGSDHGGGGMSSGDDSSVSTISLSPARDTSGQRARPNLPSPASSSVTRAAAGATRAARVSPRSMSTDSVETLHLAPSQ